MGSVDDIVCLWCILDGSEEFVMKYNNDYDVMLIVFSWDGEYLFIGDGEN